MKNSIGAQTIIFPTPVLIVGTYDKDGNPDAMNAAWGGIASSVPPTIAISVRHERKTWENLEVTKVFTINIPGTQHLVEADYLGIVSGKDADKFAAANLTAEKGKSVNAPLIKEFPLNLECRVTHTVEVGTHVHILGEILDVWIDEAYTDEKGRPDAAKIKPFVFDPANNNYNAIGDVVGKAFSAGLEIKNR
jgi:flavin reductase (DIM6/NTAB) family NADH-FMN oxidoreductase RutF